MSNTSTESKMRKLVSQYHVSGQSQREFSSLHGVTEGKLHYWIKKLISSEDQAPEVSASKSFIPISITDVKSERIILIRCSSGVEIEIPI